MNENNVTLWTLSGRAIDVGSVERVSFVTPETFGHRQAKGKDQPSMSRRPG